MENNLNNNRINATKKGKVISNYGKKTVIVAVDTFKTHLKYKKKYRSTKKFKVHDQENKCKIGDTIEIMACRPISKDKRYKVI